MFKFCYIFLALLVVVSCTNLVEVVEKKHPNGKPAIVNYYESNDSQKIPVKQIKYYSNGRVEVEGAFSDGKRTGKWVYWHPNGIKWSEGSFKNGESHGKFTVWFNTGKINIQSEYVDGKPHGEWKFYNENEKLIKTVIFEMGAKMEEKEVK
jgi:antitoxin component YwqK of YwqJK toxin-antitoxin module